MPKKPDIQKVVDILNDAFKRDPEAIKALVTMRTPCNQKLADHPTVQVREHEGNEATFSISPIGLINGIIEPLTGKRIAISVSDGKDVPPDSEDTEPKFLGFTVYKK